MAEAETMHNKLLSEMNKGYYLINNIQGKENDVDRRGGSITPVGNFQLLVSKLQASFTIRTKLKVIII